MALDLVDPASEASGRKYRSKKQRPCDLCRSRKTQCRILNGNATCELCKRLSRACTFILQPLRRERNLEIDSEPISNQQQQHSSAQNSLWTGSEDTQPSMIANIDHNNEDIAPDQSLWLTPHSNDRTVNGMNSVSHVMDWTSMDFSLSMSAFCSFFGPCQPVLNSN
jgi:hypothetical protein